MEMFHYRAPDKWRKSVYVRSAIKEVNDLALNLTVALGLNFPKKCQTTPIQNITHICLVVFMSNYVFHWPTILPLYKKHIVGCFYNNSFRLSSKFHYEYDYRIILSWTFNKKQLERKKKLFQQINFLLNRRCILVIRLQK